ncbi:MAG: hypothetical protein QGD90_02955 [Candidatus Hydrogenedentes bacterium]|nr:hypothetical protein [Candidatus Hydrogenedentota bacterium]
MMIRVSVLAAAAVLAWPLLPAMAEDAGGRIQLAQGRGGFAQGAARREAGSPYEDIIGRAGNGPKYGEEAPDFALMPLKFYEFGIDDREITEETAGLLYEPVRLSDFRGKKPVVLIFGSYT